MEPQELRTMPTRASEGHPKRGERHHLQLRDQQPMGDHSAAEAVLEYSLTGEKLREVSHRGLRDPEGITWMYGYMFAVAQEGGGRAAITIMDISPWNRAVEVVRNLILPEVHCKSNFCFEGVTYNQYKNVFYAVQEMDPMRVWEVTPFGTAKEILNGQTNFPGLRDLAGTYYALGLNRLFVLSQTEQKVAELKWNGEMVEDQVVNVYDNVVEGLTFTPDGHLMINVGEPNDLWVYTSTGDCDWEPKPWMSEDPDETVDLRPARDPPAADNADGGFCNWNNCKGGRQGTGWCNLNSKNCASGCGGVWCWRDTVGKTLTKDDLRSNPSAHNGLPSPAPEPTRSPAVSSPPPAVPSPSPHSKEGAPSAPKHWNTSAYDEQRGHNSTTVSAPRSAEESSEASEGSEGKIGDVVVKIVDSSFDDGHIAVLKMLLHDVSAWEFTPLMQLHFREAVAYAAYGNSNGFLQVVFSNPAVDQRNVIFSGILSVPDLQTDEQIVQELLDAMGYRRRHLLQGEDSEDVMVLTVTLLAETASHARLLANNTQTAIESGDLMEDMLGRGFLYDVDIDLVSITIQGAGVAPQYYPISQNDTSDAMPNATYRSDFTEIAVQLLASDPAETSGGGGGPGIPSIVAGVVAGVVALLAFAGAAILIKRVTARRTGVAGVIPRHTEAPGFSSVPSKPYPHTAPPSEDPQYTSDDASSSSGVDLEAGKQCEPDPYPSPGGSQSKQEELLWQEQPDSSALSSKEPPEQPLLNSATHTELNETPKSSRHRSVLSNPVAEDGDRGAEVDLTAPVEDGRKPSAAMEAASSYPPVP
eukprot:CAMPEP_0117697912 /NCGR_PEP_ID=MMETSP0804-20121206/29489_1 /TAXON_ID=1074897 /ORGANISM="Tetraselmis astigmatica, Strain CCMP880" /LENGTH=809 /DNA_ID=CAMNT_0005512209 /DNA_START=415 /DNA_END=2845 /DNA_ORIENTATION=+